MFNKLEEIARDVQPVTPVLGCRISEALEPKQVSEDVNMVFLILVETIEMLFWIQIRLNPWAYRFYLLTLKQQTSVNVSLVHRFSKCKLSYPEVTTRYLEKTFRNLGVTVLIHELWEVARSFLTGVAKWWWWFLYVYRFWWWLHQNLWVREIELTVERIQV